MNIFKKKTKSNFTPASTPEKRIKQKYAIWNYYKNRENEQINSARKKKESNH